MPGAGATPRKRQVHWTAQALEDLAHWDKNDRRVASRVRQLVKHIEQQPFSGIGKPEPLRYEASFPPLPGGSENADYRAEHALERCSTENANLGNQQFLIGGE